MSFQIEGGCIVTKGIEEKKILTTKNQPIKTITQQDTNALEVTLEQLQSWTSTLRVLNEFFDFEKETINKKKYYSKISCKCSNIQNLSQ